MLGLEGKDIYILRNSNRSNYQDPQGSQGRFHREINLLMISEDRINHYTVIKSLSLVIQNIIVNNIFALIAYRDFC